jgi:hypothetical protein
MAEMLTKTEILAALGSRKKAETKKGGQQQQNRPKIEGREQAVLRMLV